MTKEGHYLEVTFKEITTDNGLFCQFDEHHGVLLIDAKKSFTENDFHTISNIIDPYFIDHGELRGVIINAAKFPYWSNPQNRSQYLNFASNNHHKFKKVAFAMGGFFVKIVVRMARGRIHPEVKFFKYKKIEKAQDWILS